MAAKIETGYERMDDPPKLVQTVRFTGREDTLAWLAGQADELETSIASHLLALVDSLRLYGKLPPGEWERLEADRKAHGYTPLQYDQHVKWRRAKELEKRAVAWKGALPSPSMRKTQPNVMQTLRFAGREDILQWIANWAHASDMSMNLFFVACVEAVRLSGGLPPGEAELLERDRLAKDLSHLDYERHVWWRRAGLVRKRKPGFDRTSRPGGGGGR